MQDQLTERIFSANANSFEALALEVFAHQYKQVAVYKDFCDSMKRTPVKVKRLNDIPFLPVQFFKSHEVMAAGLTAQKVFESSTTTGAISSKHMVADISLYEQSYRKAFDLFYGKPQQYCFLALLPSYLDRGTSSLLYMADDLISLSANELSGFINKDFEELHKRIMAATTKGQKIFLLGVTYALLDFAEQYQIDLSDAIVMETGGMKGRRAELTREEIHQKLEAAFKCKAVHSEYGMTEMLSQAYSKSDGIFACPPWMQVTARDPYDPMSYVAPGRAGALNITDLANLHSCSFLSVADIGKVYEDGCFEVLGRLDNADIRGCNLMYEL